MFDNINIDELLDMQHDLSVKFINWTHEGSICNVHSILWHQPVILEIAPSERSSFFYLPKELNNSIKRLINTQNEDNKCFRWCLVRYLNPVS